MLPLIVCLAAARAQEPAGTPTAQDAPGQGEEGRSIVAPPELYGLLQVWATAYDMDEDPQADPATYGDPEDDIGFKLRRFRVGIEGKGRRVGYLLSVGTETPYDTLDESSTAIGLEDAYAEIHPYDAAEIVVGLHKVPLGREQLMSARQLALSERTVASEWLVPGRDVGITGDWQVGPGRIRLGTYNGNGSFLGDDNAGLLFATRLELAVGDDEAMRDVYRTWGEVDGIRLGFAVDGMYDMDLATNEMGGGADLMFRAGGLAVLLEGRMLQIEPADTSVAVPDPLSKTNRIGALGQVGYTFGAWEPAVRGSVFDDATALDDNGDVAEIAAGVAWHGKEDVVKSGVTYVSRLELEGAVLDNDTVRLWLQVAI